ncbi:MAG: hypothetical protein ACXVFQ_19505 [Solirubrobacteraceae bacterium]
MFEPDEIVERYVELWNQPDAERRRAIIRELWTDDCAHVLQAPRDIRDRAATVGFYYPALETHGHDALEARVARAHEEFIAPGEYVFRSAGEAMRVGNAVKFRWEMVMAVGGAAAGAGLDFVILDARGRIRADYQFIER